MSIEVEKNANAELARLQQVRRDLEEEKEDAEERAVALDRRMAKAQGLGATGEAAKIDAEQHEVAKLILRLKKALAANAEVLREAEKAAKVERQETIDAEYAALLREVRADTEALVAVDRAHFDATKEPRHRLGEKVRRLTRVEGDREVLRGRHRQAHPRWLDKLRSEGVAYDLVAVMQQIASGNVAIGSPPAPAEPVRDELSRRFRL